MNLTERQLEVLRALASGESRRVEWNTTMWLGGRDGSHHSASLMQLVRRGLAETKKIHAIYCYNGSTEAYDRKTGKTITVPPVQACCCKGHRRYKITDAGLVEARARWGADYE